jgi:hypothetical protein
MSLIFPKVIGESELSQLKFSADLTNHLGRKE